MSDLIRISGIEIRARHGVLPAEKTRTQPFVVDIELHRDLSEAGKTDDLSATVDYGKIAQDIHRFVAGNSFDLIETLAEGIAGLALENPGVERTVVTVHKPEAPVGVPFADVSVTVDRRR